MSKSYFRRPSSRAQDSQSAGHFGPLSRRDFVRVGGIGALGLSLAKFCTAEQLKSSRTSVKNCILIWLDGGPSHLETLDLKPDAPAEVRGPFQPISTAVSGTQICELMPNTAKLMQQVAVVRSVTSPLGEHNLGTHYMLTGYKPTPVLQYPSIGSVVAHLHDRQTVLPKNVAVPNFRVGGGRFTGEGFLPQTTRPFEVGGDPARADFRVRDLDFYPGVTDERIEQRKRFLEAFNQVEREAEQSARTTGDPGFDQAFRLITSKQAKEAFDLDRESGKVRSRYGRKAIGQSCLLARRLIERGVPFVTVTNRGWDTHTDAYTRLKEGYTGAKIPVGLIPSLDLAFSALIEDLDERGLLDETLILVMGEFGRTPKLNTAGGRDHWPRVFSIAMAGGGIIGGQAIGSSDSVGEGPKDHPVTPADLTATVYSLLGLDPHHTLHTSDGRPIHLSSDGRVIKELMS
jgi:hypothetical protein